MLQISIHIFTVILALPFIVRSHWNCNWATHRHAHYTHKHAPCVSQRLLGNLYQISSLIPWMPQDQHAGHFRVHVMVPKYIWHPLCHFLKRITNTNAWEGMGSPVKGSVPFGTRVMRSEQTSRMISWQSRAHHHGELLDHHTHNQTQQAHSRLDTARLLFSFWFPFWQSRCL